MIRLTSLELEAFKTETPNRSREAITWERRMNVQTRHSNPLPEDDSDVDYIGHATRYSASTTASQRVDEETLSETSTSEATDNFATPPRGSLSFQNVQPFIKRSSHPISPVIATDDFDEEDFDEEVESMDRFDTFDGEFVLDEDAEIDDTPTSAFGMSDATGTTVFHQGNASIEIFKKELFDIDNVNTLLEAIKTPRSRVFATKKSEGSPESMETPVATPRASGRRMSTAALWESTKFDANGLDEDVRWEEDSNEFDTDLSQSSERSSIDLGSADTPAPARRVGSTGILLKISSATPTPHHRKKNSNSSLGSHLSMADLQKQITPAQASCMDRTPAQLLETPNNIVDDDEYKIVFPTQISTQPNTLASTSKSRSKVDFSLTAPKMKPNKRANSAFLPPTPATNHSEKISELSDESKKELRDREERVEYLLNMKKRVELYEKWFREQRIDPENLGSFVVPPNMRLTAQNYGANASASSNWSAISDATSMSSVPPPPDHQQRLDELENENAILRVDIRTRDKTIEHAVNELARVKLDAEMYKQENEHLREERVVLERKLRESEAMNELYLRSKQKMIDNANLQFDLLRRKLMINEMK